MSNTIPKELLYVDELLRYIYKENVFTYSKLITIWQLFTPNLVDVNLHIQLFEQSIQKLNDDGYIELKQAYSGQLKEETKWCRITIKGLVFLEEGGYEGIIRSSRQQSMRLRALENHQKRHTTYMTALTLLLSVGTTFQMLNDWLEIRDKKPLDYSNIYPIAICAVGALGIACLMIVWLMQLHKKEN